MPRIKEVMKKRIKTTVFIEKNSLEIEIDLMTRIEDFLETIMMVKSTSFSQ